MTALLSVESLTVRFPVTRGLFRQPAWLCAVDDVSLELAAGETLGIVGESGCGKSTLGRAILRLVRPAAGAITFNGMRIEALSQRALRPLRRDMQVVFQDPVGSLNPRLTVGQIVAEPLVIAERGLGREQVRRRVGEAMERVGLAAALENRYPHEFSGGQCQRIGIARAIITRPRLVVCDEPVSALDVSVQGQVVNLLAGLQRDLGLTYLFISHNLAIIRHIGTRVLVLYLGREMEEAPRDRLYSAPLHPYTRALLDAVPTADPGIERTRSRAVVVGDLPSPLDPPSGCAFRTRCPLAVARCAVDRPAMETAGEGHRVACHRWREWPGGLHATVE